MIAAARVDDPARLSDTIAPISNSLSTKNKICSKP